MSREKINALRDLSAQELAFKAVALQKDLFDLRQKKITGQLDKPHMFKAVRRQIAQINTIKIEKESGKASVKAAQPVVAKKEKKNDKPKSKR